MTALRTRPGNPSTTERRTLRRQAGPLILGLFLAVLLTLTCRSPGAVYGEYYYSVVGGTSVTLTAYTGTGGNVSIPTTIPVSGTNLPVTSIGLRAFYADNLTSVTIPYTVTSISGSAFMNMSSLHSATFAGNSPSMGKGAFTSLAADFTVYYYDDAQGFSTPSWNTGYDVYAAFNRQRFKYVVNGGTAVTITGYTGPDGDVIIPASLNVSGTDLPVTAIGDYAFLRNTTLKNVIIAPGLEKIGVGAFNTCSSLVSISIPDTVTEIGGQAFSWCTNLVGVTIPGSVALVPFSAFDSCGNLAKVTLQQGVTTLDTFAFSGCSSLYSVSLPDSLTSIGHGSFSGCSRLRNISIPDSVTWITGEAFYGAGLTSVQLPKDLPSIEDYTFYACPLSTISIPSGVKKIGQYAFWYCTSLSGLTLPANLKTIGAQAFYHCTGITSVALPSGVTSVGTAAFYDCTALSNLSLPIGLTTISGSAFYNCSQVASVIIPSSVTTIGDSAFSRCSKLSSAVFAGGVPSMGYHVFYVVSTGFTVRYREGTPGFSSPSWYVGNEVYWAAPIPTLQSWAAKEGLTGGDALPEAIPCGDGVANLMKFALGIPGKASASPAALPATALGPNGATLDFSFVRASSDVRYIVQSSPTLLPGSWTPEYALEKYVNLATVGQVVKVSVPTPAGSRKFLRLQVEQ